ncbi:MAG: hypothetical protein ACOCUY_03605, partial [Verrucomicrobiota bacterium]
MTNTNKTSNRLAYAAGEFILLTLLTLVPTILLYIDIVVIDRGIGENSVVELTQETLLLITVLIFWHGSWRHPDHRGALVLVAGFFSCALIRELDAYFDYVWHGFWVWPAIIVALISIAYVVACCRKTLMGSIRDFVNTREYVFILFGLITLIVFSRTFGSGALLWKELMGAGYNNTFKSGLQEGLELYGYLFITYGACMFFFNNFTSLSLPAGK